jgi:chitodextrinase
MRLNKTHAQRKKTGSREKNIETYSLLTAYWYLLPEVEAEQPWQGLDANGQCGRRC